MNWTLAAVGFVGGFAAEVLRWWQLQQAGKTEYKKGIEYWLTSLAMMVVGGVLAGIWSPPPSLVLAFVIGGTAPLILTRLFQIVVPSTPTTQPPQAVAPSATVGGSVSMAASAARSEGSLINFLAGR